MKKLVLYNLFHKENHEIKNFKGRCAINQFARKLTDNKLFFLIDYKYYNPSLLEAKDKSKWSLKE